MASKLMPDLTAPSLADIELLARQAFATIPEALARHVRDLPIRIEDFPDRETEDEMELEDAFELLDLYRGVALTRKAGAGSTAEPDLIFLYRRPILDYWCETGDTLYAVIRHVLIHEIGHHFGLSDDDMERIETEA